MTTRCPLHSIITDGRVRRSCGSVDLHTSQVQPIVGTPIEVPLPRTVSVAFIVAYFSPALGSIGPCGIFVIAFVTST